MFEALFSPIKIRGMELKNRIIMPAMGTRMASADGEVTERLIGYHAARAAGGSGLNIVEVSAVHTKSAPAYFLSISEDFYVDGHRRLTDAIHCNGGKAGIQLWQGSIAVVMDARQQAEMLVASDLEFYGRKLAGITKEKISEIVTSYQKAAARCVQAGYDCIEFHCAHNYLPHSFLSAGFNHRTDEYGGSFENRVRFPLEVIRAIRREMPEEMPLFMRIGAYDENLEDGMTIEEVIRFCNMAGDAGVDVLDVSRGNIITEASVFEVPPIDVERGFNVDNAQKIRDATGMLTIAVGRINRADQAEEILVSEKADMVVMGRAQLADPEFCNKAGMGKISSIVHCVGCNQGCYDGFSDMEHFPFITCLRNPRIGHELEHPVKRAVTPKRVWIAGGGMGGMEAAKILKEREHFPELFELGTQLGGQFILAGEAPGKEEMKEAAISFGRQIEAAGIPVHYGQELTAEMIKEGKPEAVILATGASPIRLDIPGAALEHVVSANDVLEGNVMPKGSVCVIGGGLVGLETADMLAQRGCRVTVAEMKEAVGQDLGNLRKIMVMKKMEQLGVELLTDTICTEITKECVRAKQGEELKLICSDWVVMAAGSKANDTAELAAACEELSIPCYVVGDAKQARRALNAVAEAYEAAMFL